MTEQFFPDNLPIQDPGYSTFLVSFFVLSPLIRPIHSPYLKNPPGKVLYRGGRHVPSKQTVDSCPVFSLTYRVVSYKIECN